MSNQNQNVKTEQVAEQQVQNNVPVQAEQQNVQQVQQQVVAPQKEGFGGWLKRHWKGVVGGTAALVTAGTSAFVAYRKGKQAGMSVPMPTADDYDSLNPNE